MVPGKEKVENPSHQVPTGTSPEKTHLQKGSERPLESLAELTGEGYFLYKASSEEMVEMAGFFQGTHTNTKLQRT